MNETRRTAPRDLLIVAGALALTAAVPVAAAIRSRVASNEATAIGDVRMVIAAQAAYRSANGGWYERNFACLATHGGCIPMSPTSDPTFLDSQLASLNPRAGYMRAIGSLGSAPPADPNLSTTSISDYAYTASPVQQNQTGVRGFGGDGTGFICFAPEGIQPPSVGGRLNRTSLCRPLQ